MVRVFVGYPFTTFLTSTQTGKVLSFCAKNKSNFVRKQPPVFGTKNVCASGSENCVQLH